MVMNAMGIKRKRSDCQFEDELYNIANLAGYGGSSLWKNTWDVYEKVLKNYEDGYVFKGISKNNGIVSNIIKGIDNGIPLLLSIDYKEDGNHGHVTVAVGYTEKGIIVNDPYGNLNSGTTYSAHDIDKGDGAFEEYDKTRWFIGEKWAGYLNKWGLKWKVDLYFF